MSDNQWYYTRDGGATRLGPCSTTRLKELAQSGILQPTDDVLRCGSKEWLPANRVEGLFEHHTDPQSRSLPVSEVAAHSRR